MRPMDTGFTIWLEMSGSGPRIGIDLTTIPSWRAPAEWRAIQKDRTLPLTPPSPPRRKRSTAEDRFFVLINTAHATWWERAARVRLAPGRIIWDFDVSQPPLRPLPQLLP